MVLAKTVHPISSSSPLSNPSSNPVFLISASGSIIYLVVQVKILVYCSLFLKHHTSKQSTIPVGYNIHMPTCTHTHSVSVTTFDYFCDYNSNASNSWLNHCNGLLSGLFFCILAFLLGANSSQSDLSEVQIRLALTILQVIMFILLYVNDCYCSLHSSVVRAQKHLIKLVFLSNDKGPRMVPTNLCRREDRIFIATWGDPGTDCLMIMSQVTQLIGIIVKPFFEHRHTG